jgi:HEAT repeat protein
MNAQEQKRLIASLRSGNHQARLHAASELVNIAEPSAIPALKEAMRSKDPLLRVASGFALWRINRDVEGLEALIEPLSGKSKDAREAAVYALGAIGSEAVPFLEDCLKKDPSKVEIHRLLRELRTETHDHP